MRIACTFIAAAIAVAIAGAATAQPGGYDPVGSTLPCESKDGRRRVCPADLEGLGAVVVQNLSRVPCVEGQNWGVRSDGIWVDDGCRAEFRIVDNSGSGYPESVAEVILCESRDFRRSYCAASRAIQVRLVRQSSRSPCTENRTWGYDGRSVWVDQGCAGEFEIYR